VKAGCLQIVDALRQMLAGKAIHALEFHDEFAFDYEVGEVFTDAFSFVANWKADLSFRIKAP